MPGAESHRSALAEGTPNIIRRYPDQDHLTDPKHSHNNDTMAEPSNPIASPAKAKKTPKSTISKRYANGSFSAESSNNKLPVKAMESNNNNTAATPALSRDSQVVFASPDYQSFHSGNAGSAATAATPGADSSRPLIGTGSAYVNRTFSPAYSVENTPTALKGLQQQSKYSTPVPNNTNSATTAAPASATTATTTTTDRRRSRIDDSEFQHWRQQWSEYMKDAHIYMDSIDAASIDKVRPTLTKIGTVIESFFDLRIKILVTRKPLVESATGGGASTDKNAPTIMYPANDIVSKARAMGIKIWHYDKLIRFLGNLCGPLVKPYPPGSAASAVAGGGASTATGAGVGTGGALGTHRHHPAPAAQNLSHLLKEEQLLGPADRDPLVRTRNLEDAFQKFAGPYQLVWDPTHRYKPLHAVEFEPQGKDEDPCWPQLKATGCGRSPFVTVEKKQPSASAAQKSQQAAGVAQQQAKTPAASTTAVPAAAATPTTAAGTPGTVKSNKRKLDEASGSLVTPRSAPNDAKPITLAAAVTPAVQAGSKTATTLPATTIQRNHGGAASGAARGPAATPSTAFKTYSRPPVQTPTRVTMPPATSAALFGVTTASPRAAGDTGEDDADVSMEVEADNESGVTDNGYDDSASASGYLRNASGRTAMSTFNSASTRSTMSVHGGPGSGYFQSVGSNNGGTAGSGAGAGLLAGGAGKEVLFRYRRHAATTTPTAGTADRGSAALAATKSGASAMESSSSASSAVTAATRAVRKPGLPPAFTEPAVSPASTTATEMKKAPTATAASATGNSPAAAAVPLKKTASAPVVGTASTLAAAAAATITATPRRKPALPQPPAASTAATAAPARTPTPGVQAFPIPPAANNGGGAGGATAPPTSGHCENCHEYYADFAEHVRGRKHRKMATDTLHWTKLDALLGKVQRKRAVPPQQQQQQVVTAGEEYGEFGGGESGGDENPRKRRMVAAREGRPVK